MDNLASKDLKFFWYRNIEVILSGENFSCVELRDEDFYITFGFECILTISNFLSMHTYNPSKNIYTVNMVISI